MANASIIVLCMRSSPDSAMNRSPCRCFSLRARIGITSHSAHPRAPIGSHIQNVSVDPIQLSAGSSARKSVLNIMRFSRMTIRNLSQVGTQNPSHRETDCPVGRMTSHGTKARASGLLWFAPLGYHTSGGCPLSRSDQFSNWSARGRGAAATGLDCGRTAE